MSTPYTPVETGRTGAPTSYDDTHGEGWILFAAVMMSIVGVLNTLYGIAAIDNANFYVNDAKYVFADLNTWGWILVVIGVLQLAATVSIVRGGQAGRWFGVLVAGGNAIVQLLWIPSYPFLALSLFAIDILVIYGLIAYGARRSAA
jgi:hypothetical protein